MGILWRDHDDGFYKEIYRMFLNRLGPLNLVYSMSVLNRYPYTYMESKQMGSL